MLLKGARVQNTQAIHEIIWMCHTGRRVIDGSLDQNEAIDAIYKAVNGRYLIRLKWKFPAVISHFIWHQLPICILAWWHFISGFLGGITFLAYNSIEHLQKYSLEQTIFAISLKIWHVSLFLYLSRANSQTANVLEGLREYIDGLARDCRISIFRVLKILRSCA